MRIAVLADASLPHTQRWVQGLVERGHDCLLISLEPGSGYTSPTHWLPPRQHLPRFARYTLAISRARHALAAFRPDLVNAHFLPNYGWMAAVMGTHPLVLTVLGSDVLTVPATSWLHAWRTRWVLSRCDLVLSDAAMLTDAVCRFGFPRLRVHTVPWGIELERFPWPPEHLGGAASAGAQGSGATAEPCVVLSTRRLEAVYDVATLVEAVRRITTSALRIRIVGSGSLEPTLRAQGEPLGVTFLGWLSQTQLTRELLHAQIYASTSISDSTSVSLLEAMAAGCFPVVTDIAGNREWVEPGVGGFLFPPGDAGTLAARLQEAAADTDLRARAAIHNRRVVESRATWELTMRTADRVFELATRTAGSQDHHL